MEERMEVIRLKPYELPQVIIFRLNYKYKTELGEFIVAGNAMGNKLYVNESVPEGDVQKFLQLCEYRGEYINDPDSPVADANDYVFEIYGASAWMILQDTYRQRRKWQRKEIAKVKAGEYLKEIDKFRNEETDCIFNDLEYEIAEIVQKSLEIERKTNRNLVGVDKEYIFYLGYLVGTGVIETQAQEIEDEAV